MRILQHHINGFYYCMKVFLSAVFFIQFSFFLFAQHETDERVIGFKYILKFNGTNPQVEIKNTDLYDPFNPDHINILKTPYANSICDTLGNLLFYYDGFSLYSANGTMMDNGMIHEYNFNPYYCSTLIIPIEESNRRYYYLFETIPYIENWDFSTNRPKGCPITSYCFTFQDICKLQYHIIDMQANGGKGDIIKKNIFVADSVAPSISGVKHQNNIETWVSVLQSRTNVILNYKISSCGITPPVKNVIPDFEYPENPYLSYIPKYGLGFQLVYSTKGDMVSFSGTKKSQNTSSLNANTLFIAPFDNVTGLFDFTVLQTIAVESGICANLFSHDSKYFYYHDSWFFGSPVWMYQYSLTDQTSIPFYYNLNSNAYSGMDYGKGNDILIYKLKRKAVGSTYNFIGYLGKIVNINQSFITSNLIDSIPQPPYAEPMEGPSFSYTARNNYIYNFYHPDYKKPTAFPVAKSLTNKVASPACFDKPVTLKGSTNIPVDSLYWLVKKTGQTSWQRFNTDTFDLALTPGTYKANLVSYKYCLADTATQQFTIEDYPTIHLAEDTLYTCESKTLELPGNDTYMYYWHNTHGEIVQNQISETGQYNIVVQNSCGTQQDSLYLKNSTLYITNLITANNDNQNDCLYAVSNNSNETIRMQIYNAWGSCVFSDNHFQNNWCPGNELSSGVYYYDASYNNNCSKKGWVEIMH